MGHSRTHTHARTLVDLHILSLCTHARRAEQGEVSAVDLDNEVESFMKKQAEVESGGEWGERERACVQAHKDRHASGLCKHVHIGSCALANTHADSHANTHTR